MDNGDNNPGAQFRPGDTITPGQPQAAPPPVASEAPAAVVSAPVVAAPQPAPTPVAPEAPPQQPAYQAPQPTPAAEPEPEAAPAPQPVEAAAEEPRASFYTPEEDEPFAVPAMRQDTTQSVSWTAAEFVAHHKAASWYLILGVGAVAVAVAVWFLFKDLFASIVVLIVALLFGVNGARAPRELQYTLDNRGIGIGQKFRSYNEFRSFSVADEGAAPSIVFMPLKRFGMVATIYFDPQNEDAIVDTLSAHLPFAEHVRDPIDTLMHRIRF